MAGISLKNIVKVYAEGITAVHDFSLDIEDKEFIILVGPSGCGKSTTLRMIAGLEDITGGELYIGDRLVNGVKPKDRDIAMVFQNYALYPHMSVYKNMAFALKLKEEPKDVIKEKVINAAKSLHIEHLLDRKPKHLSGGQCQRAALGRAMVRNPAVFLLDEPLSNLDANLRTSMRTEISKLHKKLQTTFIYVTHDQVEAMTMADRIVVMKDGYIQQVDTPQNIYNNPINLFVAGFMGTPQMNFFNATVQKTGDGYAARFGETMIPILREIVPPDQMIKYLDKEVTIGIRPEKLYVQDTLSDSDRSSTTTLDVSVDVVELMGAEVFLFVSCNNTSLTAKVLPHESPKVGASAKLALDHTSVHLFDAETGMVIK
ncbi:MAG: sn-glycerol-3-phosphate ABC transporter ATP-binding protein UgpC [Oscillospiraceae bacterium]|nr:sn-glycerol-3-phosphate ABC transporter ATP-binding protein UgpC [Oscillospiraceae bacterium]